MKHNLLLSFLLFTFNTFSQPVDEVVLQQIAEDTPKPVHVGLVVLDIHKIDNLEESIRGEFVLFMRWKDSSLCVAGQKRIISIPFEKANTPQIQVLNLQEIQRFGRQMVQVSPDGTVTYRHRFLGEIHQRFDFKRFPFDVQNWTITLFTSGEDKFRIVADQENQGLMSTDSLTITSWRVSYQGQEASVNTNFGFPIYTVEMKYTLRRDPVFYIWKVVIPIILVVFMSWSVFWINPSNISAQLTVSVTAILTLIVFQFSVSQLMPPLPYLTTLDRFTIGADIFVFMAFVETIVTSYCEHKRRLKLSEAIDYYARFLFPVAFVVFILIILL